MKHEKDDQKIVIYWSWRKILNWILLIILVPVFIVFLLSTSLKNTLANPNFYKENLNQSNTYNRLIDEGIPALITEATISENQNINFLAKQGIIFVIQKSISPDWVRQKTEAIIDKIADFFARPDTTSKITLKLDDFKNTLLEINDGLVILNEFIPTCEETKTNDNKNIPLNLSIDCEKMNINLDQIKENIQVVQTNINKLALRDVEITNEVESVFRTIDTIRNHLIIIEASFWSSLIVFLILVVLLIIFNLKKFATIIRSITVPIIIGSLGVLAYSLIRQSVVSPQIPQTLNFNIPSALNSIISDFIKTNVNNFYNYVNTLSIIVLVVMIAINILILILQKHKIFKS